MLLDPHRSSRRSQTGMRHDADEWIRPCRLEGVRHQLRLVRVALRTHSSSDASTSYHDVVRRLDGRMHQRCHRDVRRGHLDHCGNRLERCHPGHLDRRRRLGARHGHVRRQLLPFEALLLGLDVKASLLVMDDVRHPGHQTAACYRARGYLDGRPRACCHPVASGEDPLLHLGEVQDDRLNRHRKKMGCSQRGGSRLA